MSACPIRQLLRPRRLGVCEIGSAEHANKYLGLMDLTRRGINNQDALARVVHKRLFSGNVMLAHHRAQPSLEPTQQIAEATDMFCATYQSICCGRRYVAQSQGKALFLWVVPRNISLNGEDVGTKVHLGDTSRSKVRCGGLGLVSPKYRPWANVFALIYVAVRTHGNVARHSEAHSAT